MGRFADFKPRKDHSADRWCVSVPARLAPTGKRMRKYFRSKHEAEDYSGDLIKLERANAKLIQKIDPSLIETAVKFDDLFKIYGFKGLADACDNLVARLDRESHSMTLGGLLESYEEINRVNWGERYFQVWKTVCSLLKELASNPVSTLDKPFWKSWMESKQKERGWSERSYNDFLSRLSSIWKYAVDNDFVERNPMEGIPRRKLKTTAVSILSIAQVTKILETASQHDPEMVPYFAIGIFAGLRPNSELEKLLWEDVNFEEKWIRVMFGNKTDTKRFVPIEANLMKWLEPWKGRTGSIAPINHVKRRRYIVRGKYQSPQDSKEEQWTPIVSWSQRDIMRHSYGSYLDGQYRDRNLVKENMGHTNFRTYDQHYRRAITPKEAETFWRICPPKKK